MNIYKKIYEIAKNLKAVERDREIGTTKGTYKITSYESVLDAVRPLMLEKGLILVRTNAHATINGNICVLETEYDVVDSEDGEKIHIASVGAGHDTSDKHAGKAMTYAMKYAFRDLFMLKGADSDDPDLSSSEGNVKKDFESLLSVEYLSRMVREAAEAGIIEHDFAENWIRTKLVPIGDDQDRLKKAHEYIKANLGTP